MKSSFTIKPKVGDKNILLEKISDGMWSASCACSVTGKLVRFPITEAQAAEILSEDRRNIDEILPDTPPPMREIFLTGLTPAEFDQTLNVEGFADDEEEQCELDE